MRFILASKSPRRREILSGIGMKFDILESSVDESVIPTTLEPRLYVQELAMLKSTDVASKVGEGSYVVGADTVVVHNGKIIGKPQNYDEAFAMLSSFSASSHKVVSGISVTNSSNMTTVTDYCETEVYFSDMSDEEISDYINTYKPFDKTGVSKGYTDEKPRHYWEDKAGGYGIQESFGMKFIKGIRGDYYNVVGLPISKLYQLLKKEFNITI
ncbi:MAG: septum formation protein Maf [Ruminococcaceae bacterium]|nr:septum formation protein Maf [Oscillospiraceae bacterium]